VTKMVIGGVTVGGCYLMVACIAYWAEQNGVLVSWPWMAAFIILMTIGELYILPVGLGLFGRLAPNGLTATTIALWFSAGFFGNLFAAWLGTFWSPLSNGVFFMVIGGVALVAALLLALLASKTARVERAA
jgi:proton-dependent oligopeptide transporter, POT family